MVVLVLHSLCKHHSPGLVYKLEWIEFIERMFRCNYEHNMYTGSRYACHWSHLYVLVCVSASMWLCDSILWPCTLYVCAMINKLHSIIIIIMDVHPSKVPDTSKRLSMIWMGIVLTADFFNFDLLSMLW